MDARVRSVPTTQHAGNKRSRLAEAVDVVRLSVGGVPFVAERDTLRAVPGSMLAAMFDPDSPFGAPAADEHGVVALNSQDGEAFSYILGWLRRGTLSGAPKPTVLQALLTDADYFGLDALVAEAEATRPETKETELLVYGPMAARKNVSGYGDTLIDKAVRELNEKFREGWRFKSKLNDDELPLPYNKCFNTGSTTAKYYLMERPTPTDRKPDDARHC
jgi:hypothetical protein